MLSGKGVINADCIVVWRLLTLTIQHYMICSFSHDYAIRIE